MNYPSQVVLITGAARRIGAALARSLHSAGFRIIVHYRQSKTEADSLVRELNQLRQDSAIALKADLNSPAECTQLIIASHKQWQRLDVLINNASSYFPTLLGETTAEQFDDLINSNFKAPFFLSQAAKSYLEVNHGSILNIADINGIRPLKNYSVYCAAKAALLMLTKSLAKELAPSIRVNCIAPGAVLWPEGVNSTNAEEQQQIIKQIPMQRVASVEDICETALFLLQQTYLTGQIINVDGGKI